MDGNGRWAKATGPNLELKGIELGLTPFGRWSKQQLIWSSGLDSYALSSENWRAAPCVGNPGLNAVTR